jgi:hypothetical protein
MAALPQIGSPLTAANGRELNTSEFLLNQLIDALDKAESAGRDMTALRLRRDDIARQVGDLKRVYFPRGPGQ